MLTSTRVVVRQIGATKRQGYSLPVLPDQPDQLFASLPFVKL